MNLVDACRKAMEDEESYVFHLRRSTWEEGRSIFFAYYHDSVNAKTPYLYDRRGEEVVGRYASTVEDLLSDDWKVVEESA